MIKRDITSLSGMSGSVYVTHLMTMRAVSLNDRRKSCAFMSFLDKLWGGRGEEKCFLIRARESNSPHVSLSQKQLGRNHNKKKTYNARALKHELYPAFLRGSL